MGASSVVDHFNFNLARFHIEPGNFCIFSPATPPPGQMHRLQKQRQPDFDLSIHGDELEQGRILLEHTLQHADLSFHLSSTPDTASQGDRESLEYPRHASEPVALRDFASFEQRSRIYYDGEGEHSPTHPWSYRTADDEEGINPYGGETMSTAAHHASNLTLGAGLGGRGYRHDISMSGAEYDPDRPLRDILPAVASHISAFGHETSRSRYPVSLQFAFDIHTFYWFLVGNGER